MIVEKLLNGVRLECVCLAGWLALGLASPSEAQARAPAAKPAASARSVPTLEAVQAKLAELEANKEMAPEAKVKLIGLYQLAKERLEALQGFTNNTASYKEAITKAPAEIARLRQVLAQPVLKRPPEELAKLAELPAPELEQRLADTQAALNTLRSKQGELDEQLRQQRDRPARARQEMADARQNLDGLTAELKNAAAAAGANELAQAQRAVLQAQQLARQQEIAMLEQEVSSHDVRIELFNLQREAAQRELQPNEALVSALEQAKANRQRYEAEQAQAEAERAEREALGKHPAVRALAEKNLALGRELTATVDRENKADTAREMQRKRSERIEQDFASARQKLEIAGLSQALGQVLREQRRNLPDPDQYYHAAKERQKEVARVGLAALHLEEAQAGEDDIDAATAQIMAKEVDPKLDATQRGKIDQELRKLLKNNQLFSERASGAYAEYLRTLGELEFTERRLLDNAQKYATFLDERLLWIPSARSFGLQTFKDLLQATLWLFAPRNWLDAGRALFSADTRGQSHWIALLAVASCAALVGFKRQLKERLVGISKLVLKPYSDRFSLTMEALGITALLALPIPLLVWGLGWRLQNVNAGSAHFVNSVGAGLDYVALPLFFFNALYRLSRVDGVAEDHFRWREESLALFRKHLRWLMPVALTALFIASVVGWQAQEAYRDSLGRLAFVVAMVAFAVFVQHILQPERGVFAHTLRTQPNSWLARLRYLWYPAGVGAPVSLALLGLIGYYYTARQLEAQLAATVWLVIGGVIVHDLVLRWLSLEQRKLAFAKAQEKREAQRMAMAAQAAAEVSGDAPPLELETHEIDLPTIGEQTRELTRVLIGMSVLLGLWFVWVQVLPALAMLDQVVLWKQTVMVEGQAQSQPITLANLALAVVIAIVTMAAARNLPGVLEIAVLKRLSIDTGTRYAVTQVLRYIIFAFGISGGFNAIGGSWAQVQWIVAALGVGLGFGLQEIFANFISGLIILFERPIRVGDTVTISDISGTVSRIRMRTTTITDWDRRALIVPNKSFITEKLINWSLDPMTRLVVKIGVVAGTDTALAQRLIADTARSLPAVLKEPEPTVYFMGLGENSLNFELRVFVKELEQRLPLTHALSVALQEAFRKHDLRIRIPPA